MEMDITLILNMIIGSLAFILGVILFVIVIRFFYYGGTYYKYMCEKYDKEDYIEEKE